MGASERARGLPYVTFAFVIVVICIEKGVGRKYPNIYGLSRQEYQVPTKKVVGVVCGGPEDHFAFQYL